MKSVNRIQILIGMTALSIGLMVYLYARPPDSALILKAIGVTIASRETFHLFNPISGQLPAFIHVFAFTLLTTGLLGCQTWKALWVCLFWLFVNVLFELGQIIEMHTVGKYSGAFDSIFGSGVLSNFFRSGTFDALDFIAMLLGAVAAIIIWRVTMQRRAMS
jgi:hypothetical protein